MLVIDVPHQDLRSGEVSSQAIAHQEGNPVGQIWPVSHLKGQMKFASGRPYADPEAAARKLVEIANSVEAVQDGRIHIELVNGPMLFEHKATPAEYKAGLDRAIERGWLTIDRSGTFLKITQAGADMFA